MAEIQSGMQALLTIDGQDWAVLCYSLSRQLFAVDRLDVEFASSTSELCPPATLLGAKAQFSLRRDVGASIEFSGIVVMAQILHDEHDVRTLHVEIAPELWRLGRRA